jgi:hypothetical protein
VCAADAQQRKLSTSPDPIRSNILLWGQLLRTGLSQAAYFRWAFCRSLRAVSHLTPPRLLYHTSLRELGPFLLDNIIVTTADAVPELNTIALLGFGVPSLTLTLLIRKRRGAKCSHSVSKTPDTLLLLRLCAFACEGQTNHSILGSARSSDGLCCEKTRALTILRY